MRKSMLKQEFQEFRVSEDEAITLKAKGGLDYLNFDDLYNKLKSLEIDIKGGSSYKSNHSVAPSHSAFVSTTSGSALASKRSKSSCDGCWVAKSWITCVNTNGNTTLSEVQGVSMRITSGVRFRRIPPAKGVILRVADSHTGNHPEDDFTPLKTIRRSYNVIRERILFELEWETFELERESTSSSPQSNVMYASMDALLLTQSENYSKAILNVQAQVLFALNATLRFTRTDNFCRKGLRLFGVANTFVDLLRSFLNLGRAGDWLNLSNRGGVDVPKALIKPVTHLENWKGVDGKFNFLLEGGFDDNQGSFSVKSVNNETPIIDAEPISVVLPANVADNIIDSNNTSSDDEGFSPRLEGAPVQTSFTSTGELKDATNWALVVAMSSSLLEAALFEGLISLIQLCDIHDEHTCEINSLRQDKATVVSKVVPDASMKLVHSDEMGCFLIVRLVMPGGYSITSLKDEYDRVGKDMANASYPFFSEFTLNPYASVEQLLSIKPRSLRSSKAP
ncbi:hypothetical protein Tco_0698979 [Tanacetum coccineum]